VIYFCSPNNPTGAAATREQLKELVDYANEKGSIIVFDAAYAPFIRSADVPKSIFEIEGARTCAMEVNSLSKYAGFTGVRLGWTIVPKELTFADGSSVADDFNRIMCTAFNGASRIVQVGTPRDLGAISARSDARSDARITPFNPQSGGLACLDTAGRKEIDKLIDYYMENAALLRKTMLCAEIRAETLCYLSLHGRQTRRVMDGLTETVLDWAGLAWTDPPSPRVQRDRLRSARWHRRSVRLR